MPEVSKQILQQHPNLYNIGSGMTHPQVLDAMAEIAKKDAESCIFVRQLAAAVPSEKFENIPYQLFRHVQFIPDVNSMQIIQHPKRLIDHGRGNCVDYTVFICSVANAMGLPSTMRMVDQTGKGFNHVYPVVNGEIYDVNYWQAGLRGKKSLPFQRKIEKHL